MESHTVMKNIYNRLANNLSANFILSLILPMAIAIPVISIASVYLTFYMTLYMPRIPGIFIDLIGPAAGGLAMGSIVSRKAKSSEVNNPKIVIATTLVAVCVLRYVQWCVYIPLIFSEVYENHDMISGQRTVESFRLFFRPDRVFQSAMHINELGVWSQGDTRYAVNRSFINPENGIGLLLSWVFYFAAMIVFALVRVKDKFLDN